MSGDEEHHKNEGHRPESGSESWRAMARYMVQHQLAARGISDSRVLRAMAEVPRHAFVPPQMRESAYDDRPLDIGWGQTISQPYMVAHMTEWLRLEPTDRVLEIGTGSGYHAAVLSLLADHVDTVERDERLAHTAAFRLRSLGYHNVTVIYSDGTLGCPQRAPYDAIVVVAAAPQVPETLKSQLALGGRLICPVGTQEVQTLVRVTRTETGYHLEEGVNCLFVPLIGREGWKSP